VVFFTFSAAGLSLFGPMCVLAACVFGLFWFLCCLSGLFSWSCVWAVCLFSVCVWG